MRAELLETGRQVRRTVRLVHTPAVEHGPVTGLSSAARELDGLLIDRVVQLEHGNVVGGGGHAPVPARMDDDVHHVGQFTAGRPVLGADAYLELFGLRGNRLAR